MKITTAALAIGLVMAAPAGAQDLADLVYNSGANLGMAERLAQRCPRYKLSPQIRREFALASRLNRSLFSLGREAGRDKVDEILAEETDEDMAKAMACFSAVMLFGPHGSAVANVLIEDPKVAAREERERKRREAEKEARIRARKDEPAPAGANEADLIVEEHDERPDKLTGRHAMSIVDIMHHGKKVTVGCVPCFNAMTLIAIYDGVPYAINGHTRTRHGRYRVVIGGTARPVRDVQGSPLWPVGNLIERAAAAPGCDMHAVQGGIESTVRALTEGVCLSQP